MASSRDAQAGWNIFRNSGYEAELDDINAQLVLQGFTPVAMRTFSHYRKLRRYGYERYVPINQLDVETLKDPIWEGPLRSRFRPRSSELSASLVLIQDGEAVSLDGRVVEISPTEAILRFPGGIAEQLHSEALENQPGLVTFTAGGEVQPVQVDLAQVSGSELLLTVSFIGIVATGPLTGRRALASGSAAITFDTANPHAPVLVLRHLHALFEALDAARVVCDEILRALDPKEEFVMQPLEVQELRLQSPLLVAITSATPPLLLLLYLLVRIEQIRNMHYQGSITKGQAGIMAESQRALRIKNEQEEFRASIERSIIVKRAIEFVRDSSGGATQLQAPLSEELVKRADELVERQLMPGLERLLDPDVRGIEVETDLDVPTMPELDDVADGEDLPDAD